MLRKGDAFDPELAEDLPAPSRCARMRDMSSDPLAQALAHRLLIVTGKGGVGKSTAAVVLARAAAARGQRVLLAAFASPRPFGGLLEELPPAGEIRAQGGLSVVHMTPQETLKEYVLTVVRFQFIYKLIFENRWVRQFLRAVPSLAEMMALGKLWYHLGETEGGRPRFDLVVLDAPATGHARGLLQLPRKVQKAIPPGPLAKIARDLSAMLTDRTTGLVLVALPEETPVQELLELAATAREERVGVALGIVNACYPALPLDPLPAAEEEPLARLTRAGARYRARRALHAEQLARLRAEAPGLPLLVWPHSFGRPALELLEEQR